MIPLLQILYREGKEEEREGGRREGGWGGEGGREGREGGKR